jgi:2'-5' RNA ligase
MLCRTRPAQQAIHSLFFAIRPPAEIAVRIAEATASLPVSGKAIPPGRLHVSTLNLVRESSIPSGLVEEAAEAAGLIDAAPFMVMFDRLIAGPQSMLLLPSEPLDQFRMFRERLGFTLMRAGLNFQLQGRFNPHLTLLYGNELMFETEIDPIIWRVEDFVLIDSVVGERKHVEMGRWTLRP